MRAASWSSRCTSICSGLLERFPELKTAEENTRELSITAERKILGENAARLYHLSFLPPPSRSARMSPLAVVRAPVRRSPTD